MWSLGCILYTLLIGKPPFETSCLKDTYAKIKKNEYAIPPNKVTISAKNLINHLLQADPTLRPTMGQILQDEFFFSGYLPTRLPTTCLSMPPRFDRDVNQTLLCSNNGTPGQQPPALTTSNTNIGGMTRKPLLEINDGKSAQQQQQQNDLRTGAMSGVIIDARAPSSAISAIQTNNQVQQGNQVSSTSASANVLLRNRDGLSDGANGDRHNDDEPEDYYLSELYQQLNTVISARPIELEPLRIDDAEDPACVPMLWISKWVDYSDKYGLGYQLCDDSVGVLFNDSTRLILCSSGEYVFPQQTTNLFLF